MCCYGRGGTFLYISSVTTSALWPCETAGCCDEFSRNSLRSVQCEGASRAVTQVFQVPA